MVSRGAGLYSGSMLKDIITSAEIGAAIRVRRSSLGLTQEQLAEKLGVSYQQVQRYENGVTTLNVENVQIIARALGLPVASLFVTKEVRVAANKDDPARSVEEKTLLRIFKKLPTAADKKLAINVIRRFAKQSPVK